MFDNTKVAVMSEKVEDRDLKLGTSFTAGKRAKNFLGIHWRGLAMVGAALAWGAITFATGGAAALLGGILGANYMVPTLVGSAALFFVAGALPFRKRRKAAITQNKIARAQRKVDKRVKSFQKEHQLYKNYENHLANLAENADLGINKVSKKYRRSNKRMMRHLNRMLKHQKAVDSLAGVKMSGFVNKMKVDADKYVGNVRDAEYNAFEMTHALSEAHNKVITLEKTYNSRKIARKSGNKREMKMSNNNVARAIMRDRVYKMVDKVGARVQEFGSVEQKLYEKELTDHVEKRRNQRLNPFPERRIHLDAFDAVKEETAKVETKQGADEKLAQRKEKAKTVAKQKQAAESTKQSEKTSGSTLRKRSSGITKSVNKRRGTICKSCNQYKVISLSGKRVFAISDNSLASSKSAFEQAEKNNQELSIKFVLDEDGRAEIKDYSLKP